MHPADQLALLRSSADPDASIQESLEAALVGDREARVGDTHHAVVTRLPDGWRVDVRELPDLADTLALLEAGRVSLVDTETTGLHPRDGDRVVSVAATEAFLSGGGVAFGGLQLVAVVNPGRPSSPKALEVHGLDEDSLAAMPRFPEVARFVGGVLEGRVLVAHNAPFDIDFLDREFEDTPFPGPSQTARAIVDTRVISKMLWPGEPGSLDALANRLGVDRGGRDARHDALADAVLLGRCLPGLAAEIRTRLNPVPEGP